MNERADELANVARLAASEDDHSSSKPPIARDLFGQERVVVSVDEIEVTGSYRGALERLVWKQRLKELATTSKESTAVSALFPGVDHQPRQGRQARVAKTYGPGIMAWCDTARRSRNPSQLKFAMEALATWLPTEATVMVGASQGTHFRGERCKLCPAVEESVAHALGFCPDLWSAHARRAAIRAAVDLLKAWGVATVVHPTSLQPLGTVLIPAWFDPACAIQFAVCDKVPGEILRNITLHDPVDGLLGFHPRGVDKLLQWSRIKGKWTRNKLGDTLHRKGQLQATLQRGALRVWTARCQRFSSWWFSCAGKHMREAGHNLAVGQAGARATAAERKEARTFSQQYPARPGSKSRADAPQPLLAPAPQVEVPLRKVPRALSCLDNFNAQGTKDTTVQDSLRPQTSITPMYRDQLITDEKELRVLFAEADEAARIDIKARDRATRFAPPWY
jgi:hypothetical protein